MGRSRGDLTSKIYALVDADGRPVALRLTGGQVHDSQEAEALLDAMPEGATLLADKGYDSNAIREAAARRKVWANIPSRSNRKQRFPFSGWLYRHRNLVDVTPRFPPAGIRAGRLFCASARLKQWAALRSP